MTLPKRLTKQLTFQYGLLDSSTYWVAFPSGTIKRMDGLTLKVLFDIDRGLETDSLIQKYHLDKKEIESLWKVLEEGKAITPKSGEGKIEFVHYNDVDTGWVWGLLAGAILLQFDYFVKTAKTTVLQTWFDVAFVSGFALFAIFLHEMGHWLAASAYFRPKFGFKLLGILPAVYVDTHKAWSLPRNARLLVSVSGFLVDMVVNSVAILFVLVHPPLEYFVTPFLVAQWLRLSIVMNPLIEGDGYWVLSDLTDSVNLATQSKEALRNLQFNIYFVFGLASLSFCVLTSIGFVLWIVLTVLSIIGVV